MNMTRVMPEHAGLVATLAQILTALYATCRGVVNGFAGRGSCVQTYRSPADSFKSGLVPVWILRELEYVPADDVQLTVATQSESGDLLDAPAAWVEIERPAVFGAAPGANWAWRVPPDVVADVDARLGAYPLPPSIVIDQGHDLLALWLLDTPAPLDQPPVRARIDALQRALADRLHGRTDDVTVPQSQHCTRPIGEPAVTATLPAWHVARPVFRIPGTHNRDHGAEGTLVTLDHLDLARRYSLDALSVAGTGPTSTPASTTTRKGRIHA